ncbi:OmpA family protein [Pseudomonas sp. GD03860]|uniref:OmpA family protein n=1 Tax=Pseudomonas TaxID=286 RepID=UPI00236323F5|nr:MULTISPECIES: OmpA family protein [Pseudomonas]MDD2056858.1 OmpA family protein [Pseudomonas putida]MDH0637942.1 OmpA family protein [Pseudomonas sp. GD03860]
MTALFDMHMRIGSDPRGFDEFVSLHEELSKLAHPGCPDIDWIRVEQLCLVLLEQNGAELHTASAYILARSHSHGVEGMVQGLALMETLVGAWPQLWPALPAVRLEVLDWLFAQMQAVLRRLEMTSRSLPALVNLNTALARVNAALQSQVYSPLTTLQALRQQVASCIQRVQRQSPIGETLPLVMGLPGPNISWPVLTLPPTRLPVLTPRKRTARRWLVVLAVILTSMGGAWLWDRAVNEGAGFASLFARKQAIPEPLQLDSLRLFDAGSAELKPGSAKVLISALVDIKARPGWLIVISGHADTTGNAEQNQQLSEARAVAVREWMQRMGDIPDNCFAVQGGAASQPIASNETLEGRSANRRVDIQLVPQVGACGTQ